MSDHIPPTNLLLIFKKESVNEYSLENPAGLPIKNPAGLAQTGANCPFVDVNLLTTLTKEMKVNENLAGYSFLSSFCSPNADHVFVVLEKNEPIPEDDFETIHRPLPEIPAKSITTTGPTAGPAKTAENGWGTIGTRDSASPYESDSVVSVSPKNGYYHRIWEAVDHVHKLNRKTKIQRSKPDARPSCPSNSASHIAQSVCDDEEYGGWALPSATDSAPATVSSATVKNNESTTLGGWCPVDPFTGDAHAPAETHEDHAIRDDVSVADTEPLDDSFYERYYEKRTVPLPVDEKKEIERSKANPHGRGIHRCHRGDGRQFRPRSSYAEKLMAPMADEVDGENSKRRKVYQTWGGKQTGRKEDKYLGW